MESEFVHFLILYVLYDKFETDGDSKDIRVTELMEHPDLNYIHSTTVSAEIDYLAGKKFITGSSGTGKSPFDAVRISNYGIEVIKFILKEFPKYLSTFQFDGESLLVYRQISAFPNDKGKLSMIYSLIQQKPDLLDAFLEMTSALSSNRTPIDINYILIRRLRSEGLKTIERNEFLTKKAQLEVNKNNLLAIIKELGKFGKGSHIPRVKEAILNIISAQNDEDVKKFGLDTIKLIPTD